MAEFPHTDRAASINTKVDGQALDVNPNVDDGPTVPVEPTHWSYRSLAEGDQRDLLNDMAAKLRADGVRHARATLVDGGIWMEGWPDAPWRMVERGVEAPFNPPLTLQNNRAGPDDR